MANDVESRLAVVVAAAAAAVVEPQMVEVVTGCGDIAGEMCTFWHSLLPLTLD